MFLENVQFFCFFDKCEKNDSMYALVLAHKHHSARVESHKNFSAELPAFKGRIFSPACENQRINNPGSFRIKNDKIGSVAGNHAAPFLEIVVETQKPRRVSCHEG